LQLPSGTLLGRSGEISPLRAKVLKARLYQGSFKYKHGDNVGTRPSLLRGSVAATYEKDTDTERWEKDLKEAFGYSFEPLRDKLTLYMRFALCAFSSCLGADADILALPPVRLRKVLGAYNDGRPFSLDLVGAVGLCDTNPFSYGTHGRAAQVLRQDSFTEKMHQLGWSQPGFFDSKEDEVALHHCVSRYHAYVHSGPGDSASSHSRVKQGSWIS